MKQNNFRIFFIISMFCMLIINTSVYAKFEPPAKTKTNEAKTVFNRPEKIDANMIQQSPDVWYRQTIDAGDLYGDVGWQNDIAVDANGYPHIIYTSDDSYGFEDYVKYAYYDGNLWHTEIIRLQNNGADISGTSIVLDTQDNPHVAFGGQEGIVYAEWTGSTWITQTVGWGYNPTLVLDSLQRPRVSYHDGLYVKYAYWDGTTWQIQTVDEGYTDGNGNALALDSNDVPHLVYGFWDESYVVMYANRVGIGWNIQVVNDTDGSGWASIDVDSSDKPHISYSAYVASSLTSELRHAKKLTTTWQTDVLDTNPLGIIANNLLIDNEDDIHISYSFENSNNSYSLKYAYFGGTSWLTQIVDSSDHGLAEWNAIAVAVSGNPYFSYLDSYYGDLKFAYGGIGLTTWQAEVVDSSPSLIGANVLVIDNDDGVHISYRHEFDGNNVNLRYAHLAYSSSWVTETVDSGENVLAEWNSIAVTNSGDPYISYLDYYNGDLLFAYKFSNDWYYQTVDAGDLYGEVGWKNDIADDVNGYPHISYASDDAYGFEEYVKYAYFDGNQWQNEMLYLQDNGADIKGTSIALDVQGYPHIAFGAQEGIIYAEWSGSAWLTQTVGWGGFPSLVLDSLQRPHLTYSDGNYVKYAYWDGITWQIQIVDEGSTYDGNSLALDSNDVPHVVYTNWEGESPEAIYAMRVGLGWNIQTVNNTDAIGWPSLDVDSNDQPHVSYSAYIQTSNTYQLRYAKGTTILGDTYSIFGTVKTESGIPIPNVTISTNTGQSVTTGSDGNYAITGLITGTYTIAAANERFQFVPSSQVVNVPPSQYTVNFTGIPVKKAVILVQGFQGLGNIQYDCYADGIAHYDDGNQNFEENSPDIGNIADWLTEAGFDVWSSHLSTGPDYTASLRSNAQCLRNQIEQVRDFSIGGKVILIAHSMGGLVSRAYLEDPSLYENDVETLITLGTPHLGTPYGVLTKLNDLLNFRGNLTCDNQIALCEFTEGISEFNRDYSSRAPGVEYYLVGGDLSFWDANEKGKLINLIIGGPDDATIPTYSATHLNYGVTQSLVTSEAHNDGVGNHSYFKPEAGDALSFAYYYCILPVIQGNPYGCQHTVASVVEPETLPPTELNTFSPVIRGTLLPNQEVIKTVYLDTQSYAIFTGGWASTPVTFTLTSPTGQVIDPTYVAAHPELVNFDPADPSSTYQGATYTVFDAEPGTWILKLASGNLSTSDTGFTILTGFNSDIVLQAGMDKRWYMPNTSATITATLSGSPTNVSIDAVILRSDGVSETVSLSPIGSGLYQGLYSVPDVPGYAEVSIRANGTVGDGSPIEREALQIYQISPQSILLTNSYHDIPKPGLSHYEGITITVGVNVVLSSTFGLSADLVDSQGNFVAHSLSIKNLATGATTIQLFFEGSDIFASQKNGPYTLTNLLLTDKSGATLVVAEESDVYLTSPYTYSDFGSLNIYLPIVVR